MRFAGREKTKKHGILLDGPVDDDGRCRDCGGACCQSFPSVDLSWIEYERLRDFGATRLHFSLNGHCKLIIENGCEFLAEGRCAIYPDRPDVCRRFFCRDA
jgi:Fe-S-cluster containining protein